MKYSVLLPTRNGEKFLANCIRSILEQEYDDFELVVSDNANTDGTPEVLRQFEGHPQLKIIRQEGLISVAENWTAALEASQGEYVLMMGDDDYLLPDFFSHMEKALRRYEEPDAILYNGYSYVHPMSIADNQTSFWNRRHYSYIEPFTEEMRLSRNVRMDIVQDMFRFKQRIPLNMQTMVFRRGAAEKVIGGVFPAPFPDHYLINAMLISAENWVFLPDRLVIVGVSPKSFGHYHYSHQAKEGLAYLGINTRFPGSLPGSELVNGMYTWLLMLKENYPEELREIEIDKNGYIRRQAYSWLIQYRNKALGMREMVQLFRKLGIRELIGLLSGVFDRDSWRYALRLIRFSNRSNAESQWKGLETLAGVSDIREFSNWLKQATSVDLE